MNIIHPSNTNLNVGLKGTAKVAGFSNIQTVAPSFTCVQLHRTAESFAALETVVT